MNLSPAINGAEQRLDVVIQKLDAMIAILAGERVEPAETVELREPRTTRRGKAG